MGCEGCVWNIYHLYLVCLGLELARAHIFTPCGRIVGQVAIFRHSFLETAAIIGAFGSVCKLAFCIVDHFTSCVAQQSITLVSVSFDPG